MQKIIYPYNDFSRSARVLAQASGFTRVKRGKYAAAANMNGDILIKEDMNVVNWGSWQVPNFIPTEGAKIKTLNKSPSVKTCSLKSTFFEAVGGTVRIPKFTTDLVKAMEWVKEGRLVLGRKNKGSGGTDIVFSDGSPSDFSSSQFWTVYKKKAAEYRVHVFRDSILLVQKKVLRSTDENGDPIDKTNVDFRIRNHDNGFIFQRNDFTPPEDALVQARKAVECVGLDFGAVDVIYNQSEGQAYVLEVNTAPGLEGSTVDDYARAINSFFS